MHKITKKVKGSAKRSGHFYCHGCWAVCPKANGWRFLGLSHMNAMFLFFVFYFIFFFFLLRLLQVFSMFFLFPSLYISFWIHLMHLFSVAKLNSSYNRSLILRLSPQILSLSKTSDSRYNFNTQSITGRYSCLIIIIYFSILFLNFALSIRVPNRFFFFFLFAMFLFLGLRLYIEVKQRRDYSVHRCNLLNSCYSLIYPDLGV